MEDCFRRENRRFDERAVVLTSMSNKKRTWSSRLEKDILRESESTQNKCVTPLPLLFKYRNERTKRTCEIDSKYERMKE